MKSLRAHRCLREALFHTFQILQNHSILFFCCSYPRGHFINSFLQDIPVYIIRAGWGETGSVRNALYRWSLVRYCRNAKASFPNMHPILHIVSCDLNLPSDTPQHAGTAGSEVFRPPGFSISTKCDVSEAEPSTQYWGDTSLKSAHLQTFQVPAKRCCLRIFSCTSFMYGIPSLRNWEERKCQVGYNPLNFLTAH